jgi:CheY-like chemotaxis protein
MRNHEPVSPRTRVLVVEDQPVVAQVIAEVLEADGYVVDTAANGRLALDQIEARPYDLIISDVRMPELDGVGLYREIQRRQPELLSRFVFASGATDLPEYYRFLAESAVQILDKPFTLADFRRLTRQVLAAHVPEPART